MARKISPEGFIEDVKKLHPQKYDLSNTVYTKRKDKVLVTYKDCGCTSLVYPSCLLRGTDCKEHYSLKERKTTEDFIKDAEEVHGKLYDYSLVDYKSSKEKVKIICKKHGIFKQSRAGHITEKRDCPKCARLNFNLKFKKKQFLDVGESNHFLYLIHLRDDFYKIGISGKPEQRLRKIRRQSGLDAYILKQLKCDVETCFFLELKLHEIFSEYNAVEVFYKQFGGYSECFKLSKPQLEVILKTFENLELNDKTYVSP